MRSLEEEEARLEATGAYAPEEDDEGENSISNSYFLTQRAVINWQESVHATEQWNEYSLSWIDELDEEEKLLYDIIKDKQAIARKKNHETKTTVPKKFTIRGRSESSIREQLETVGLESDGVINSTMGGKKRNRYATL